jgi:ubiquinone/menaquinone biosynthesis C-methylase UbiE
MTNSREIASFYDDVATAYDTAYRSRVDLMEDSLHGRVLGQWITASDYVLDIGCGTGHALTLMPTPPRYYIGVDSSTKMLEMAREKFPDRGFYPANAEELFGRLSPGDFHVALATYEVMNYVGMEPSDFARELARIASRGCIVSVASPLHPRRDTFTRDAPGKSHWRLEEVRAGFAMHFSSVRITGFSSRVQDLAGGWLGVRCPARWAYYWLIEAEAIHG